MQDYTNKIKNEKNMYIQDYTNKYLKYKTKYNNEKNIYGGGNSKDNIKTNLIYFGASWCGHCRTFGPTWERIESNKQANVNYIKYDADDDKHMLKKYNISGFPTVILETNSGKDNKLIEYVGSRSYEGIQDFITKYT